MHIGPMRKRSTIGTAEKAAGMDTVMAAALETRNCPMVKGRT